MRTVALMILAASLANAETLVLTPVQDAYICDCQPDVTNPNGGPTHLYHGRYTTCNDRSLIQWDLSGLPAGAQVQSAVLRLYCISFTGTPSGQPVFYLIDGQWDELTVTHNTDPGHSQVPFVTASWPEPQTWFEVDVTVLVEEWLSGSSESHGIYCTSQGCTSTSVPGFLSKDSDHPDLWPRLVITYTLDLAGGVTWGAIKSN